MSTANQPLRYAGRLRLSTILTYAALKTISYHIKKKIKTQPLTFNFFYFLVLSLTPLLPTPQDK